MNEELDNEEEKYLDLDLDLDLDNDLEFEFSLEIEEDEDDGSEAKFEQKEDSIEETSSHKKYKKHSLSHDSIFKGKKETLKEDGIDEMTTMQIPDKIEILPGTIVYEENRNPEEYNRLKKLKEKIYDILLNETDLNFNKNRRKPSKKDFNSYYDTVKRCLKDNSFSECEIFVELAVYFSDNLFNMFKLLEEKKGALILEELKEFQNKSNSENLDDYDFI